MGSTLKYGWAGTILNIDLSKGKIFRQTLDKSLALGYIGGRGLNLKLLFDYLKPGVDPLGPGNPLIIGTGPCGGTIVPGSCRLTITAKSPVTGFIGDSNCCSNFSAEMKYAGYDVIAFYGKASHPIYVWIEDDKVELRDAEHIWGKSTWETQSIIKEEVGDYSVPVLAIGPAGENLVKFASIITGLGRAAGRCGVGTVMGSKLLKAVAIRGSKSVNVANQELLEKTVAEWMPKLAHGYHPMTKGTMASSYKYVEVVGGFSIKNYQTGYISEKTELTSPDLVSQYYIGAKSCISCPVACNLFYVIDKGKYAGTYGDGFEMTHLQQAGSRLGSFRLDLAHKVNSLLDQYGIDVSDFGGVVGFVMECYEKGILTKEEVNGLEPEWGSEEAILKLLEMIAYRKGIGNVLAEGIKKAAEIIGKGSEKYALHVKGIGFSTVDPRAAQDWGLGYAVASRGACHMRAAVPDNQMFPLSQVVEGKGGLVIHFEHIRAVEDSLEVCKWMFWAEGAKIVKAFEKGLPWPLTYPETLTNFYNFVTGVNINVNDMLRIGERIVNLERVFNIREGLTKNDDTLPDRFLKEPLPEGSSKGKVCKLDVMLDEYYEKRGWDKDSGFPTRAKLKELKLNDAMKQLINLGKKLK